MKHGMKASHNPRLVNAAKQIAAFAERYYSGWRWGTSMRPFEFFERMFYLKFKADKYDILNKLVKGHSKPLVSFIRGDIRLVAPKAATTQINMVLVIFILILTF